MLDLEAEMAKALEGKFYWEHSRDPDEQMAPAEREIRAVQKRFRPRDAVGHIPLTASLDERVERVAKMVRAHAQISRNHDPFELLKNAVAFTHDVAPSLVLAHTNNKAVSRAKHHFYWTALRHFPGMSLAEIARQIGKHHSVLIHSREKFEPDKASYLEEIEIVDRVMEQIKCG